jgi:hypothetical protein
LWAVFRRAELSEEWFLRNCREHPDWSWRKSLAASRRCGPRGRLGPPLDRDRSRSCRSLAGHRRGAAARPLGRPQLPADKLLNPTRPRRRVRLAALCRARRAGIDRPARCAHHALSDEIADRGAAMPAGDARNRGHCQRRTA